MEELIGKTKSFPKFFQDKLCVCVCVCVCLAKEKNARLDTNLINILQGNITVALL